MYYEGNQRQLPSASKKGELGGRLLKVREMSEFCMKDTVKRKKGE